MLKAACISGDVRSCILPAKLALSFLATTVITAIHATTHLLCFLQTSRVQPFLDLDIRTLSVKQFLNVHSNKKWASY